MFRRAGARQWSTLRQGVRGTHTRAARRLSPHAAWKAAAAVLVVGMAAFAVALPIRLDIDPTAATHDAVTVEELQKHNSRENGVWVAINGDVYDLTLFLDQHPGGAKIILRYAGQNALAIFNKFHAKDVFAKFLGPEAYKGKLDGDLEAAADITEGEVDPERLLRIENLPPVSHMFNLLDFEAVAKQIIPPNAWAYYLSAADDEVSNRENHYAFHRIFFNPKVLVDVRDVDISTTMLGHEVAAPFYCLAAAQAKLGHPDGEIGISNGCGKEQIIQMISLVASYSFDEIMDTEKDHPGQAHWFQLYVQPDRLLTHEAIAKADSRGAKGLFVTVDTCELGNREKDAKFRINLDLVDDDEDLEAQKDADLVMGFKDPGLTWADIKDFKSRTKMPIVLKGVQRVEDVLLAAEHGCDAVVLLNHGGRQLDFARSPIEVLADVMPELRKRQLDEKIEVYIDGGVRRGTDVIKALCLGAKGVGLGRSFLYANSCYGEAGVTKAIKLLKEEIRKDMKLLGATKILDLDPSMLDLRGLYGRPTVPDYMYEKSYEPLAAPKFRDE